MNRPVSDVVDMEPFKHLTYALPRSLNNLLLTKEQTAGVVKSGFERTQFLSRIP